MATIYRFIVEGGASIGQSQVGKRQEGGTPSKKPVAKTTSILRYITGNKGGVEANRKMRAINPLINKSGIAWEKFSRVTRASLGLIKVDQRTGKFAGFSGPAVAILVQQMIRTAGQFFKNASEICERENANDFKKMQVGKNRIHGDYSNTINGVATYFTGRVSYKEND